MYMHQQPLMDLPGARMVARHGKKYWEPAFLVPTMTIFMTSSILRETSISIRPTVIQFLSQRQVIGVIGQISEQPCLDFQIF